MRFVVAKEQSRSELQAHNQRELITDNTSVEERIKLILKEPALTSVHGNPKWMMFGLAGAAATGWIGGIAQGWPLLSLMRYGDEFMLMSLMGIGFTLVVVASGVAMTAAKSGDDSLLPPEGVEEMVVAELENRRERKRRKKSRSRRRGYYESC
eukprot:Gregarina_sp_Poly_1__1474@NODE_136_length_13140_cov_67_629236_g121_i0_p10_GENE_NODE_136_length_13140_cov_67_629236_g121_i0NODE_136_length_13140_cov_67_629236_g121_i0_p10_ORF_typecomplete_len153_score17_17DUF3149/PF11346_8/0_34_NODE_136_length_13140_cov_67_629236_g121_i01142011878